MNPDPPPDVTAELASLRRQVRVQLVLLLGALALAALAFWNGRKAREATAAGGQDEYGAILARSLYLEDEPDNPYVRLKFLHEGGGLVLSDSEGRGQVNLTAAGRGGRLSLGTGPATLVLDSGTPEGPALLLKDEKGRDRVRVRGGAEPGIELLDEAGRVRLRLSAQEDGPSLALLDAEGRVIFQEPAAR